MSASHQRAFIRGALTLRVDPPEASWRGRPVSLSPIEARVFVRIAMRGRLSFPEVEETIAEMGGQPATRSTVIFRIRRKFQDTGAANPLRNIAGYGFALVIEPDERDRGGTVIGLDHDLAWL